MERRATHGVKLVALVLAMALALPGCAGRAVPDIAQGPVVTMDPTAQADRVLIVTGDYPPYVTQDKDHPGFLTEIVQAAAAEAKMEIQIEYYPWDRCRQMVQQGEAWATYPFEHSAINDSLFAFSKPLCHATQKFYYLSSNKNIQENTKTFSRIQEFKGYTFGGTNGYWYGTPSDFIAANVKIEWTSGIDALVKMLHAGRIDFFIEDQRVAGEAIGRLFPEEEQDFATLPLAAKECDYHLIVSKSGDDALLRRFNGALDKLRANGEYDRILSRYKIS